MNEIEAYNHFYKEIIEAIDARRFKAYKSLNEQYIQHYFESGGITLKHQETQKWGRSIVEELSKDITKQRPRNHSRPVG